MSRLLARALLIVILAAHIGSLIALPHAAAQDAAAIEALALKTHIQNLRTHSYTAWLGGALGDPANAPARTPLGERLDSWRLIGFGDDSPVSASDRARPVLLNFWASWCPPCRFEFPHLVKVALAPDAHAFDVLFVNSSDTEEAARAFLADYPDAIHVVLDAQDRLAVQAGIQSLPTSVLLAQDGTVLAVHVGMLTPTVTRFLDAVAAEPGVGLFVAADHPDVDTGAILAPIDLASTPAIEGGDSVAGTISEQAPQQAYRFEGHAGDVVTANVSASHNGLLDTYLVLMAVDGTRLTENDDVEPGVITDSTLTASLPQDGTYLLVVTRFLEAEGFTTGDYRLELTITLGAPPDETATNATRWTQRTGGGFIGYNSSVRGTVSGLNHQQLYAFEGRRGDEVSLRLTHDPGPTLRVEVKDTHQRRLALSDWSGAESTTSLDDLVLPDDGYYRIAVMRPHSRDTAETWFMLALIAPAYATPPQQSEGDHTLAYDETVRGTLDDAQFEQRWTFEGTRGDRISLAMQRLEDVPGGLDGYLIVEGPDGTRLLEVDDTQNDVMPRIDDYALTDSGTYTVIATRFGFANGLSVGAYTLRLERAAAPEPPPAPAQVQGVNWLDNGRLPEGLQRLRAGESLTGALDDAHIDDWYIFRGAEGEHVTLRMAGQGGLDPFLILTDERGYELARSDDASPGTTDAAIEDFALPAASAYLVRATRYGFENGPSQGGYQLTLESGDEKPTLSAAETTPLELGVPADGTLALEAPDRRYSFEGRVGQRVTASVLRQRGDLVPALSLHAPDGTEIAGSREGLDAAEARIDGVRLPLDGTYTLDVLLQDLSTSGDYRVVALLLPDVTPEPGAFVPAADADLEVVLIWGSAADLDLSVESPASAPGPIFTHRANDSCADPQPVPIERAAWDTGTAAPGLYRIRVRYRLNCASQPEPVAFMLGLAANGTVVDLIGGALPRQGDLYTTWLEYPAR